MVGLPGLLAAAARDRPHAVAARVPGGRTLTWAEWDREVSAVAGALGAMGFVLGHRILIAAHTSLEAVTCYLAVQRTHGIAVPVNPGATAEELGRLIADSGARHVIADTRCAGLAEAVDRILDAASTTAVGVSLLDGPTAAYPDWVTGAPTPLAPLTDAERTATLAYTSGAMGDPRGVMLTHRALTVGVDQIAAVDPPVFRPDDVVAGTLPLFHPYFLGALLGSVLASGAELRVPAAGDRVDPLDLVAGAGPRPPGGCTVVPAAPALIHKWAARADLADRFAGVRWVSSGAAAVAEPAAREFHRRTGLRVDQGYGLAEAPVVTSTLCRPDDPVADGSVGWPVPGVDVSIVDDAGGPVEGGDSGSIRIRGDNLFSGYWPDAAQAPNGWWPTGDMGFVGPGGDLVLVDRWADTITVSGFQVYPSEVEAVVCEVEGVSDAAVVGVRDDQTGHAVVAYVVAPGHRPEVITAAITSRCAARLARFKRPARIAVVDSLPHTVTGKLQRSRLRREADTS